MRISIVTGFFLPVPPICGGATEKIWYGLAQAFAAQGHSITIISRRWRGFPNFETHSGITHIRVAGFKHTRYLPVNLLLDFIWGMRVTRALPCADAVICNTIALPVWLRRLKPSAGLVTVMIGRNPKGQVTFYGNVARIYVPSTSVAEQVSAKLAAGRIRVTGYPINWTQLSIAGRQPSTPVTIGFVGRLHPEKGLALLLAAGRILGSRSKLPSWRLVIAGPKGIGEGGGGEAWVETLKREHASALAGRIEWHDAEFDSEKLAVIYGGIDIFCYPSLAEKGETFGVAVAEAMSAGCAVVVSALRCFNDLVTHGKTGLIFDHNCANADILLADQIESLVQNAGLRRELSSNGRERSRHFDFPVVAGRILDDLAFLTGTGPKRG